MFHFERKIIINRELKELFSFFENPRNLAKITPPTLGFVITTKGEIVMKKGTKIEYTIKVFGIRLKWVTLITDYNPPQSFQDTQLKGPYKKWEHTHLFKEIDGKVEMTDKLEYDLYGGILKYPLNSIVISKKVKEIFDYRNKIMRNYFK